MSNISDDSQDGVALVQPKMKKGAAFPERYSFPIYRESSEDENQVWNCVIGHLKDACVEVSDEKNMELLFCMGFFGKGSLSRSTPRFLEEKFQKQFGSRKRKKTWSKPKEKQSKQDENVSEDEIEVVLSDTNDSAESTSDAISETTTKEVLQLSLEEAYFLSYGLGVLIVKDKDQPLDLLRLWYKFCEIHPHKNFPAMYTAYHHFRSKGWIVRSGLKYGADYALYKNGPPFYHSSYAVIVKPVKEQNLRDISVGGRPNLTWSSLAGLNRVCTHVSKAVIILYVIKPNSMSENKVSTPFCISEYKLEEVIVNRWVPSEDRSEERNQISQQRQEATS